MATTAGKTTLVTNIDASPPVLNDNTQSRGRLCYSRPPRYTQSGAGDAGSTIDIDEIPAGARVDLLLSFVNVSAFGAARTLRLGWRAFTKPDGTTEAEDDDGLCSGIDVSGAALKRLADGTAFGSGVAAAGLSKKFDAKARLFATVNGGTIPDGATVDFVIAYLLG